MNFNNVFEGWHQKMKVLNSINTLVEEERGTSIIKKDVKRDENKKSVVFIVFVGILLLIVLQFSGYMTLWSGGVIVLIVVSILIFVTKKKKISNDVSAVEETFLNKKQFLERYGAITEEIQKLWNTNMKTLSDELIIKIKERDYPFEEYLRLEGIALKREYLSFEQGAIVNKFYALGSSVKEYNEFVVRIHSDIENKINSTVKQQLENYRELSVIN